MRGWNEGLVGVETGYCVSGTAKGRAAWRPPGEPAGSSGDIASGGAFRIHVVRAWEEFLDLAERWNALLGETQSDNIFLTWEWLYTWARCYLAESQLWIVMVFKNTELVAIAPFCVWPRVAGVIKIRELRFLGSEDVGSANLDVIVRKKHRGPALRAIYRHLHEEARGAWDLLTLSEVPAESPSIDLWDALVQETGRVMEVAGTTVYPVIDLQNGLKPFVASLSANERSNLRRKQRGLEGLGRVTYERVSSSHDVEQAMQVLIHLHQVRWERRGTAGVFGDERRRLFHRDIVRAFSEKGWLRLEFLLLDGEAIAGVYGYGYRDRYSFYLPALNPAIAAKTSPGILLLFRCIEEAVREGYKEFDLLRGAADYKMAWATGLRRCVTLQCYNRHLRSAAVKALESGKSMIKMLVR
jgi:CelD/BcsL family acetyltransferase involved in cellulose biosynthesis